MDGHKFQADHSDQRTTCYQVTARVPEAFYTHELQVLRHNSLTIFRPIGTVTGSVKVVFILARSSTELLANTLPIMYCLLWYLWIIPCLHPPQCQLLEFNANMEGDHTSMFGGPSCLFANRTIAIIIIIILGCTQMSTPLTCLFNALQSILAP